MGSTNLSGSRGALFFPSRRPLVLASASPRRVALLRQAGAIFTVADPGPDRAWPGRSVPRHGVRALALDKARRVAERRASAVVVGADTVVVARGVRLGKPDSLKEAAEMLTRLQGRTHEVWSGLAVACAGEQRTASECTRVTFARLSAAEIQRYLEFGESLDKAGAYGVQGAAAQFVTRIEGDWTNVVGLPLARLRRLLAEFA
jgi:septum formation protein